MYNRKILLLRVGFALMTVLAILHTSFVVFGVPLPETDDFLKMQDAMNTIEVDSGGGIMRTTQDFMDGFNIIVSIYLFSLPIFGWVMLADIQENNEAVRKLTILMLISEFAFFLTSSLLLAIGGTILSAIVCVIFLVSILIRPSK